MNTFQVVNYIRHNTDPYWSTAYCAVKISLRILQDNNSIHNRMHTIKFNIAHLREIEYERVDWIQLAKDMV
jgi:hypothetical protein